MNMYDVSELFDFVSGNPLLFLVVKVVPLIIIIIGPIYMLVSISERTKSNLFVDIIKFFIGFCLLLVAGMLASYVIPITSTAVNQRFESGKTIQYSKYSEPVLVRKDKESYEDISFTRLSDGKKVSMSTCDVSNSKKLKAGQVVKIRLVYIRGAKHNKRYRSSKEKPIQYKSIKQPTQAEIKKALFKIYLNK